MDSIIDVMTAGYPHRAAVTALQTRRVERCLQQIRTAGERVGFRFHTIGRSGRYPLWAATREGPPGSPAVYVSAGIHGDEPAGPLAVLELFRRNYFPHACHCHVLPMLCPRNLFTGRRCFTGGLDPNRDYQACRSPEIRDHVHWMRTRFSKVSSPLNAAPPAALDAAFCLHEDWESRGFYLYELNLNAHPSLAGNMLAAARTVYGIQPTGNVDGHRVCDGLIYYGQLPKVSDGCPEALFLNRFYAQRSYTLETPSSAPMRARIAAHVAALRAAFSVLEAHPPATEG